ncbi:MAG: HlyD family efflux transporter periplasmic adaptor subunit [Armatimonas sp.]
MLLSFGVRQAQEALAQAQKAGEAKVALARAALRQAEGQRLSVEAKAEEARAAQRGAEKAAADVASARIQADLTTIHAPISGVVTKRLLGPGDMADATTPVLELTNTGKLDLVASLPADDAARIRPGQSAHLSRGGEAIVASIGAVDPQTNLAPVRLQVRQNGTLRSGDIPDREDRGQGSEGRDCRAEGSLCSLAIVRVWCWLRRATPRKKRL